MLLHVSLTTFITCAFFDGASQMQTICDSGCLFVISRSIFCPILKRKQNLEEFAEAVSVSELRKVKGFFDKKCRMATVLSGA